MTETLSRRSRTPSMRHTDRKRARILERDGDHCWLCHQPFTDTDPPTLDHVIPWSKGGNNKLKNLKLAHAKCNERRGNRDAPKVVNQTSPQGRHG